MSAVTEGLSGSGLVAPVRSDTRFHQARLLLVLGWLVVVLSLPVVGERNATWTDVRRVVATGAVSSVRVDGELRAGSTGYSTVQVHWREGAVRHATEVGQVRGVGGSYAEDGMPVLRGAPSARLLALQPGLDVTRGQWDGSGDRVLGWWTPHGVALAVLVLFLAGLVVLVAGPEPWRATRWAWFWLSVPPIGNIVFLLLSGPIPGLPRPRDRARRLRGGWALLLGILLMGALAPYRW